MAGRRRGWGLGLAAFAIPLAIFGPVRAQVAFDGSLGVKGHLQGPAYQIPATRGQVRGGNLFHSFESFGVPRGESATFAGPAGIRNILARVTGGGPSRINGTVRSTIAGADLFLINPSGVIFGPGAALDLSGSFHVSTANVIQLGKDGVFDALPRADRSVLTSSSPSAFGFLSPKPASLSVRGEADQRVSLIAPDRRQFSLVGGALRIEHADLVAASGRISLIAVDAPATVRLRGDDPLGRDASESASAYAPISLRSATLDAGDASLSGSSAGGRVIVHGGQISANDSIIGALTFASGSGGGIEIEADRLRFLNNTLLTTVVDGPGRAGPITLAADVMRIDHASALTLSLPGSDGSAGFIGIAAGELSIPTGILSAITNGSGAGGLIDISVSRGLTIGLPDAPGTAAISAGTVGSGLSGDLILRVGGRLTVNRNGIVSASTRGTGAGGNIEILADQVHLAGGIIRARTEQEIGGGDGGDLFIRAGTVRLSDDGRLFTSTFGDGDGGTLRVEASDSLRITGTSSLNPSGILADTFGAGRGGDIFISAPLVSLSEDGFVSSSAFRAGRGGDVRISAGRLSIVGTGGDDTLTAVITGTARDGAGGDISIRADSVTLRNAGQINSSTAGAGRAGDIRLRARRLLIDSTGHDPSSFVSGIAAATSGAGDGGSIDIRSRNVLVQNEGGITTRSSSGQLNAGAAGNLSIRARHFALAAGVISVAAIEARAGQVSIQTERNADLVDAILTARSGADGGNVLLTAGDRLRVQESEVTARAGGDGGRISIDSRFVVLNDSVIDGRAGGRPVEVTIDPDALLFRSIDSRILTRALSLPPAVDIAGSLVALNPVLLDSSKVLQDVCAAVAATGSTFTRVGRGGVARRPGGFAPAFGIAVVP